MLMMDNSSRPEMKTNYNNYFGVIKLTNYKKNKVNHDSTKQPGNRGQGKPYDSTKQPGNTKQRIG